MLPVLGGGWMFSYVLGFPARLFGFVCENVPRKKGDIETFTDLTCYYLVTLHSMYEPYDWLVVLILVMLILLL